MKSIRNFSLALITLIIATIGLSSVFWMCPDGQCEPLESENILGELVGYAMVRGMVMLDSGGSYAICGSGGCYGTCGTCKGNLECSLEKCVS